MVSGMEVIHAGRRAAIDLAAAHAAERPTPGAVYLRVIARALEKHLMQDTDCALHWVSPIGETNPFGPPSDTEVWRPEFDDSLVQVGLTDGNSEGMLLYVHAQASRYEPAQLVPLLRIKVLCGHDRAAKELTAVHRWFNSQAFRDLLQQERSWTTFSDLNLGTVFFDPKSGETFEKTTGLHARCLAGGDAMEGDSDQFDSEDRVQRLLEEEGR